MAKEVITSDEQVIFSLNFRVSECRRKQIGDSPYLFLAVAFAFSKYQLNDEMSAGWLYRSFRLFLVRKLAM